MEFMSSCRPSILVWTFFKNIQVMIRRRLIIEAINLEFYLRKLLGYIRIRSSKKLLSIDAREIPCSSSENILFPREDSLRFRLPFTNSETRLQDVQPRQTFLISCGMLNTHSGLVYFEGSRLIVQSSSWPLEELQKDSYKGTELLTHYSRSKKYQKVRYKVCLPSSGFYHWLIEDLPRVLFLLLHADIEFDIICFRNPPSYVNDVANLLGINLVKQKRLIPFENLILPAKNSETGKPNPFDISILRQTFLKKKSAKISNKKIYVSRLKSSRSPEWEKELITYLLLEDWHVVYCETLTLSEQIETFLDAAIVCGVHGAGLSGIVWSSPQTKVIELVETHRSDCFKLLAQLLAQSHVTIDTRALNAKEIFLTLDAIIRA